jgi:hypothetical protein
MDRIGRILDWRDGIATVEVGRNQECARGSCADCHASDADRWVFQVPWKEPWRKGQKVLVKPRGSLYRFLQWGGFLLAFSLSLALLTWLIPGAAREGPEQRISILVGIVFGAAMWKMIQLRARGLPRYRVVALESPRERLTLLMPGEEREPQPDRK